MTTIKIPEAGELRQRLAGLGRLLTARKWERAAIVFAFTDVGGPRNTPNHRPPPPRLNIRNFAGQGYTGLTTPKAVSRYREAWVTAIAHGWAVPVGPGDEVTLPDEPFPAWPYGEGSTWEDHAVTNDELVEAARKRGERHRRPLPDRVAGALDSAAAALRRLADSVADEPLTEDQAVQLVERLTIVRDQADQALQAIGRRVTGAA
jgi:hypothetical protein